MNSSTDDNRYAPPQTQVEDIPPMAADGVQLAGRGARLGAVLIDAGLFMAVFGVTAVVTPWNVFREPEPGQLAATLAANAVGGLLLFLLFNGYLLARHGQTVGKRLLGLRIVRPGGERASFARLFGARFLVGWVAASIPGIGALYSLVDGLLIFRESRRCLHDNIADTIVVKI
jgi:uncharacterized RDD family membrane protein YckC